MKHTEIKNQTVITEFLLVGLTNSFEIQTLLLWVFILIYAMALAGNSLLIFTIWRCRKLHTPMYFLLLNLSFVNVFSISITIPKLIQTLLVHHKSISFYGCIAQAYLFIWALGTELLLLSFMAFDRCYAAICHPLQYTVIMRKELCIVMAAGVWVAGMVNSAVHAVLLLELSFCSSNVINHFFCDLPQLFKLSCSDTSLNETMTFASDVVFGIGCCGLTLTSYWFILRAIFRIRSTEGKKKAFSTCSSHLIVVSFYFSAVIYTYIRPTSVYSLDNDKLVSLLYSVVTPVVNPIIYSLRNKEVKKALKTLIGSGGKRLESTFPRDVHLDQPATRTITDGPGANRAPSYAECWCCPTDPAQAQVWELPSAS
ncbi:LOW QUALITY PROTEIN: olfactory receptor 13G1-like [Sphaerodactylus townsendi]|uniref:LOW QUALITY PROTEIN: olfactory receptor 13G1-like n=1 Tax=Sphaerodactylus townsendi TaxID=933632 RepID=UPI0020264C7E|nr:LOW QUALITY PROTEIN: olfactory receptor 13G1-like [Sphaerodactylus townsendi]